VVYAAGAKFEKGELPNFVAEKLTGLSSHVPYIHDKFMLIDPLGDDPTTVTGSANFSPASQINNDENMLVIRSDQRVADVYFSEFMRLFEHRAKSSGGYLRPNSTWVADHFGDTQKSRRRQYFHGAWGA
jgi:phosphatidylserine/phosphatidylglycerophosphate/cardiolipin synthase-like enzyme